MSADSASASTSAPGRLLPALFIGVFMAALDTSVIAPAIPALRASFGLDNREVALVMTVFSLCSLCSTAPLASLGDRHGRRPVYLASVALFALGSLVIALSPNFATLLAGRAIQGVGGGGIIPTASAVIGDVFAPKERARALGLIGATYGMAFVLGPPLAGLVMVVASWQWIFLINLPIAAIVFFMSARALPSKVSDVAHPPFDYAGIATLALILTTLTLGINRALDTAIGQTLWPTLLATAAIALPLLLLIERRAAQPIVPLTLFVTRQLRTTWALCVGAGFGMGSVIFITSIAVAAFNTPSKKAGLLLLPLVLCSAAASAGFGRIQHRLGARAVMLWGFGTLGIGSALIGFFAAHFWMYMLATLFIGTGVGIVVGGTLRTVVLNEVTVRERSAAQALVNIGIAIGNLMVVAVLSFLADRAGGGLEGLSVAYRAATVVMLLMMVISLRLQPSAADAHAG